MHVLAVSQGPLEQTPPSVLAALAHGFEQRNVECSKPTHKIRVDFKVGHIFKFIFTITEVVVIAKVQSLHDSSTLYLLTFRFNI